MDTLVNLELTLINAAKGQEYTPDELRKNLGRHTDDFALPRLSAQFMLLSPLLSEVNTVTVESIIDVLQKKSEGVREIFDEVIKYLQLLLSIPASVASGEHSFSALRRIKMYLRSRMTQSRLTHLLLLHVHKGRTSEVVLDDIINEFVNRTTERTATFGST